MTRRITAFGDRMLTAVLPRGTAGACVPASPCSYYKNYVCHGNTGTIDYCTGMLNCHGACTIGIVCTQQKAGGCS
jgi:hypothetical protein